MADFLSFSHISKTYPGVKALSDVSFGVEKGSVHGLIGENGAGKSTLIRILSGDTAADTGDISIDGATLYCTHQPCSVCAKMIINAGIQRVVYQEGYPDDFSLAIFKEAGVRLEQYKKEEYRVCGGECFSIEKHSPPHPLTKRLRDRGMRGRRLL